MILLVHDLRGEDAKDLVSSYEEEPIVIADDGTIQHCIGCFGCWVKTPGECVIKDGYSKSGGLISSCSELHLVSECVYGGYSHFVKNVLDRSISFVHPDLAIRQGQTHHRLRYEKTPDLHVWFYGKDLNEAEQQTARALVAANAVNLGCNFHSVSFGDGPQEIKIRGGQDASGFNQR